MNITLAQLKRRKACADQVALFRETFGDSAEVTRENLLRAAEAGLNLAWGIAARLFRLSDEHLAEYQRQEAPLWAEYQRQEALLWEEYQQQKALLWEEYQQQKVNALADVLGLEANR